MRARVTADGWIFLGLGLVTAPAFAATPVLSYMGWFLSALCHEMGHSTVACALGMPAFPALRLDGHAASVHQEPSVLLALLVWAALAGGAWALRMNRGMVIALAAATLLYPALAFTDAKELLFLLAGHLGELAMATYCFVHVLDGGFTSRRLERLLHGTLAWHLLGGNVLLCLGLAFRPAARNAYAESGSFGLTNDLIRVADDVLGWRLESVALLVLLVCLAPLPLALWLRGAADAEPEQGDGAPEPARCAAAWPTEPAPGAGTRRPDAANEPDARAVGSAQSRTGPRAASCGDAGREPYLRAAQRRR